MQKCFKKSTGAVYWSLDAIFSY